MKLERSNAYEKINVESRLQLLGITAAARQGSPELIDPTVEGNQPVVTKTSPTNTISLHAGTAASVSPNRTDVVSKVEDEVNLDAHRNFGECKVPVTNLEAQQKLQSLLTDARTNWEVISDETVSVARRLYRKVPIVTHTMTGTTTLESLAKHWIAGSILLHTNRQRVPCNLLPKTLYQSSQLRKQRRITCACFDC